eukprot:GHVP01029007.1.p1 GENE.GHVP01029007.1~~GHVP01029007.1.p1  ORF type:complete len:302 (+),score=35.38 GHVP01029007.1:598-1503(+)
MTWTDCGANIISTEGTKVTFTGSGRMCAYYNTPMTRGHNYMWELTVESGKESPSLGVTCKSKFAQGWDLRGILYHGNTSDGSGLITQKFGPLLKTGDKVKMLVEVQDRLNVAYSINGQNLGCAFSLDKYPNEDLFVVVVNGGPSTFSLSVDLPPVTLSSLDVSTASEACGVAGTWALDPSSYTEGGAPATLPSSVLWTPAFTKLTIEDSGPTLEVMLQALNMCKFTVTKGTPISVGPGYTTAMAGEPERMEVESRLIRLFSTATTIERQGADLLVTSPNSSAVFLRYTTVPSTCKSVPRFE